MSRRTQRVASLIQTELGELILKKLKDPRIGFITITGVDITPDLKLARVHYSVLGKEKQEKAETQKALEHAAGYLQHQIADDLKLRFTPRLTFHFDESVDRGLRIEQILQELKKDEGPK